MEQYSLLIVITSLSTFPASFLLTKFTLKYANKIDFISYPQSINLSHKTPAAYGGGISIGITIFIFLAIQSFSLPDALKFIMILLPVLLTGLLDDIFHFTPLLKIVLELISIVPFLIIYIKNPYYIPFVIIFLLLSQNAWNLIDVMDGLTAGVSVIIFISAGIIILIQTQLEFYATLSFATALTVYGFRFWNKYPAKIFLGDTGSLLLGSLYAFIVVSVFLEYETTGYFLALLGVIPFFELIFLIIIRTKNKIPFYKKTTDHFALRMYNSGLNVRQINLLVIAVCIVHTSMIVVFYYLGNTIVHFLICLGITLLGTIMAYIYIQSIPAALKNK
jgi:UDP-GlcNAc:undecaprenyl-phosphate GlcNAc-1-phosphate transferase